jgi:hypothetical protein
MKCIEVAELFSTFHFYLFQMAKDFKELIWDYLVFIILVIVTSVVPLWGRFFGKKKTRTKADYVFATGAVSVFSMMLSIARGTLGVRSFLGKTNLFCLFLFKTN